MPEHDQQSPEEAEFTNPLSSATDERPEDAGRVHDPEEARAMAEAGKYHEERAAHDRQLAELDEKEEAGDISTSERWSTEDGLQKLYKTGGRGGGGGDARAYKMEAAIDQRSAEVRELAAQKLHRAGERAVGWDVDRVIDEQRVIQETREWGSELDRLANLIPEIRGNGGDNVYKALRLLDADVYNANIALLDDSMRQELVDLFDDESATVGQVYDRMQEKMKSFAERIQNQAERDKAELDRVLGVDSAEQNPGEAADKG